MDAKLMQDFNDSLSVINKWNDGAIVINSLELHASIRALLAALKISKSLGVQLPLCRDILTLSDKLIQNDQLPTDIALLAGKIYCMGIISIFKELTVEELLLKLLKVLPRIPRLCYFYGIIDTLHTANDEDSAVALVGEAIIDFLKCFNSKYFYPLKLLHTWLVYVKSTTSTRSEHSSVYTKLLMPNSEILTILLMHWETPFSGCVELCSECLSTICQIWKILHSNCHYAEIVAKTTLTDLLWKSKTKYLILSALVPFVNFSEILCEYPDSVYSLTGSLNSNYLLPAGTSLFRTLAKNLCPEEWVVCCQGVLLDALNHNNEVIRKNASRYWLPCVSHTSPENYAELKAILGEASPTFNWLAYVSLLKIFPTELSEKDHAIIVRALKHGEEDVRMTAFGLLIHSKKKTEPVRKEIWDLAVTFLLDNLHSDNPQFRHQLSSNLKKLLVRVLENSLSLIKTKQFNVSNVDPQLKSNIDNIQQLHDSLIQNLFTGASYQRKVGTLGALLYIFQLFTTNDGAAAASLAKGANIDKRHLLIQVASANSKWNWSDYQSMQRYAVCLMDEVQDIRERAAAILRNYFRPPSDFLLVLYRIGFQLCDSPKFQRSECGATILQLVAFWAESAVDVLPQLSSRDRAIPFLMNEIQMRFDKLDGDWLTVASQSPVHGFIGVLSKVLQMDAKVQLETYQPIIQLCQRVSNYMLVTLSSKSSSDPDTAPSFEEMGESIDDIVRQHRQGAIDVDDVSISVYQQIVLACAWLNLKESAFLALEVSTCLLVSDHQSEMDRARQIEQCADVIVQILLRCRHKGAIEATGDALGTLCKRLFASQEDEIRSIPKKLLTSFLTRLELSESGASITRRSAGLTFIVGKIVSSEPVKSENSLVGLATERLISVAGRPVEDQDDLTCDLPQPIAMHILQSLVHDAALSVSILPWMESIVLLCINSFAHPHWSIRNAALQLFGSVIPRLVGQTKNRDSPCGSPTSAELFHKFPKLEELLFSSLTNQEDDGRLLVSGGLIPSLSLLSRLSPGSNKMLNEKFSVPLAKLLGHSVVQVRVLAAQSLLAFVPLFQTKRILLQLCDDAETLSASDAQQKRPLNVCRNEGSSGMTNMLHGCLLTIYELLNRCKDIALSVEDWEMIRNTIGGLSSLEEQHPSFYIRLAILKLFETVGMAGSWQMLIEVMKRSESEHRLNQLTPGYVDWMQLKTELVLQHFSFSCIFPAIKEIMALRYQTNGIGVAEPALKILTHRVARLSSSSVLANSVVCYVNYYIQHADTHPNLLPICLNFVLQRGATCLVENETSLKQFADFFLDKCIETKTFGITTAIVALPTVAVVIRESLEKSLIDNAEDLNYLVLRLTRVLLDASQPTQSIGFRMAASQSLKSTGKVWLEMQGKGAEASHNLFMTIFHLIQDEEKDVRWNAATFLTEILHSTADQDQDQVDLLSCSQCMKEFVLNIHRWFDPFHLLPLAIEWLSRGDLNDFEEDTEDQRMYAPENPNFFSEEDESVEFISAVAASCLSKIPVSSHAVLMPVDQLLNEADALIKRVEMDEKERRLFTRSEPMESALRRLSARLRISCSCFSDHPSIDQLNQLQMRITNLGIS